jgi:glycosyltransferase involved in cell wall biosynthesis
MPIAGSLPATPPRIAIVTPSLNQGGFLKSTIDSVIGQNYPALFYHVQDGGSTDGSLDILRAYGNRLSWASESDGGQSAAINRGFEGVYADIMAYLNSDDLLLPGSLAYVANIFADRPELDLVYSHRISIDEEGREIGRWILPPHDAEALRWADYVPQETMFWRRRVWQKVGPLDENLRYAMDWDFLLRAQAAGFSFQRVPRFLACFRVHDSQKTTAISSVGVAESERLRQIHLKLGRNPTNKEIMQALRGYLFRHVLFDRLYRASLLRGE